MDAESFRRNCSELRGSKGLKGANRGRIPVADAQADGYQTAFVQFDPRSLNSYFSPDRLQGPGLFLKMSLFGQEKPGFCRLLHKLRHLFALFL